MKTDSIINDKIKIQNHLSFCSSFLLVYEYFISSWKQGVFFLFKNCKKDIDNNSDIFHTDVKFRRISYDDFKNLKNSEKAITDEIKKCYKRLQQKYNSDDSELMFFWLLDNGFISLSERDTLEKCRKQRNIFAHEIERTLNSPISQSEKDLLQSLISIAKELSLRWNDKVKSSTISVKDYVDEIAKEYGFEPPKFETNTIKFYSLVLQNINDIIYGTSNNA